jgi:hypothetical protein
MPPPTRSRVGRAGSSQALRPQRPRSILKDRRYARGERHQHLAIVRRHRIPLGGRSPRSVAGAGRRFDQPPSGRDRRQPQCGSCGQDCNRDARLLLRSVLWDHYSRSGAPGRKSPQLVPTGRPLEARPAEPPTERPGALAAQPGLPAPNDLTVNAVWPR